MMASKETFPTVESSLNSPAPKRVKKSPPTPEAETEDIPRQPPVFAEPETQQQQAAPEMAPDTTPEALPEYEELEAVRVNF